MELVIEVDGASRVLQSHACLKSEQKMRWMKLLTSATSAFTIKLRRGARDDRMRLKSGCEDLFLRGWEYDQFSSLDSFVAMADSISN